MGHGKGSTVLRGKFIAMSAYIKRTERSQIKDLMLHLIQRINETKSCFFEKINKIDRSLENLTKMRGKNLKSVKIRNVKREITTNTTQILGIIETTLRTYIQINLKILNKWINF
jgi:hypothetical protein